VIAFTQETEELLTSLRNTHGDSFDAFHILSALLSTENVVTRWLESKGINRHELRSTVAGRRKQIEAHHLAPAGALGSMRMIHMACSECGHEPYVGLEHVFVGLMRDHRTGLAGALESKGLRPYDARGELFNKSWKLLGEQLSSDDLTTLQRARDTLVRVGYDPVLLERLDELLRHLAPGGPIGGKGERDRG
jgi:ATP-dependent Clp protease ATP-binding subunit ClpA